MSGTPVPIYVKKRSNSTASTKFFRASSKKVKHSRKKSNVSNQRSSTGSDRPVDDPAQDPAQDPAKDSRPSSLENAPPQLKIEPPQAKSPPVTSPRTITGLPSPPESPPPTRKLPDIPVFADNWPLTSQNQNANGIYGLSDSDASAHHNLSAKPRGRAKLVKNPSQINKAASRSPGFGYLSDGSEGPKRPSRISSPVTVWSAPDFEPRKPYSARPRRNTQDAATSTSSLLPAPPPDRGPSPVPEPPPRSPTRPGSILLSADELVRLSGPEAGNMNQYIQSNGSNQLNPAATYQHIQDMAAKRVSTLDYLRKT